MPADRRVGTSWLTRPEDVGLHVGDVPVGVPIRAEHALAERARSVESVDDGEPLVPVQPHLAVHRVYADLPFEGLPPSLLLRESVVERLTAAARSLPSPFSLSVIDGWRSLAFQRELLGFYARRFGRLEGFVSDPDDRTLVPPHVTGGAVDLTLTYESVPLALGTDFDEFRSEAAVDWFEGVGKRDTGADLVRRLRRLLAAALTAQDFVPLPEEWWHWSFGDQRWAAARGLGLSRYGLVPG